MSLSEKNEYPIGIELREAYIKIRDWYQANITLLEGRKNPDGSKAEYIEESRNLILNLPDPSTATELEMRAVIGEIIFSHSH